MCGNQISCLKAFLLFDSLTNCLLGFGMPLLFLFFPLCFSPSSLCYKQPTTSLITQHEYEAKSCHSLCHEIKSGANPVYQKLVHVNSRLLARACHAHRGSRVWVLLPPELARLDSLTATAVLCHLLMYQGRFVMLRQWE